MKFKYLSMKKKFLFGLCFALLQISKSLKKHGNHKFIPKRPSLQTMAHIFNLHKNILSTKINVHDQN